MHDDIAEAAHDAYDKCVENMTGPKWDQVLADPTRTRRCYAMKEAIEIALRNPALHAHMVDVLKEAGVLSEALVVESTAGEPGAWLRVKPTNGAVLSESRLVVGNVTLPTIYTIHLPTKDETK